MSEKISNQNAFAVRQTTISYLKVEWRHFWRRYCPDQSKSEAVFQSLVEKYSEKHRAYHNLSHICYLLKEVKKIEFEDADSVYLTVWFHDLIYNPKRGDNEIQSAKLAVKMLRNMGFPTSKITKIEQIILATQIHSAENLDDDGKIFLDLDLSILGADIEIYRNYSRAIRQEYSHVSTSLFRRGRKKILEKFLKREVIYFTLSLRERFEERARLNLANEIKELS